MRYEGTVYRPPSEARSLIIQVTIGCSHNKCTFCSMYKDKDFRIRPMKEILEDIDMARKMYTNIERVFLADGDALVLKTEKLKYIIDYINEKFPECQRISIYATPRNINNKSLKELMELKKYGLKMMYMGIESGSDDILDSIKKGVNSREIVEAGIKVKKAGIKLSVTLISGLGGKEYISKHAIESAKVINKINPDYIGLLTLMLENGTKMYEDYKNNRFKLLTPEEILKEIKIFIENIKINNTVFRSNHASNYVPLSGVLSQDKEKLLNTINNALKGGYYRDERLRSL